MIDSTMIASTSGLSFAKGTMPYPGYKKTPPSGGDKKLVKLQT